MIICTNCGRTIARMNTREDPVVRDPKRGGYTQTIHALCDWCDTAVAVARHFPMCHEAALSFTDPIMRGIFRSDLGLKIGQQLTNGGSSHAR